MTRTLAFLMIAALIAGACGTSSNGQTGLASSAPPIEETPTVVDSSAAPSSDTSETTTSDATAATIDPAAQVAWSVLDAERDATNFLAALSAGAYEQAAWPLESNGGVYDDQKSDENAATFVSRMCADSRCAGPYSVDADGPGIIDAQFGLPSSTVTVIHEPTGEQATLKIGTFEGQRIVSGLPPLLSSDGEPSLVNRLFGDDRPDRVVVQRFDAFEIWENNGKVEWVTHWFADETVQIEGDFVATWNRLTGLRNAESGSEAPCNRRLMVRDSRVLVFGQCETSNWALNDAISGEAVEPPIQFVERFDGEFEWFAERGGAVLTGVGDAEGNITEMTTLAGIDVLGDDYASTIAISTDGTHVAYVDHRDPNAVSHFESSVVVVRDLRSGDEVGRWVLDLPVNCLEFAASWIVVCENSDPLDPILADQSALTAINHETGEANRVETPVRVFLPT